MALTKAQLREILSNAGAEADRISDAVDKIIAGHTASIEALREERDQYKASAQKTEELQKELDTLKKNSGDITKLQKEYDDFKASVENEKVHSKKVSAYKDMLKELGIPERHHAKILKYSDVDGIEVDDEGHVKNAKTVMKSIKEDWADHIETASTSGVKTPTPPASSSGGTTMTKKEIMAIKDTTERQTALKAYLNAGGES